VGALGHYLEEEGIPTTQVSLVREHTAALNPPRALWVPFMLGRPFGVPGDAAFQRRVLLAALHLFERAAGPVLEDYPEDAPHEDLGEAAEGLNCPVTFPRLTSDGTLAERLADEISQLAAWHEVALRHRGRSTVGLTGLAPDALGAFLAAWLADPPPPPFRGGLDAGQALKLAADELKAFYYEAKAVQPGRHSAAAIQDWFWLDTAAGQVFLELRERARRSVDPALKGIATTALVPRAADAARAARTTVPDR
jgi:hypothetical protein